MQKKFNPFPTNASFLYPLKTSEKLGFLDVFRRYRSGKLVENSLKNILIRGSDFFSH